MQLPTLFRQISLTLSIPVPPPPALFPSYRVPNMLILSLKPLVTFPRYVYFADILPLLPKKKSAVQYRLADRKKKL